MNMEKIYDIAIIGAGVVGAAIARELSRYDIKVILLEGSPDVGMGTSKASTAIWHTGYDSIPGSLESTLLKRGYPLLEEFMKETGSPYERLGGLLIAWNPEQLQRLPDLLEKANRNGDTDCFLIDKAQVYELEPHLGEGALGGMFVPREGILCTFTIPLALAMQAVVNGVTLKLNFRVTDISTNDELHILSSKDDSIQARWVVNAAGLFADEINAHFGIHRFEVKPRRGELIVFDKLARKLVNHVLLPVPTSTTKGILVSPTIYGNVLLGPTSEEVSDKFATNTSTRGLEILLEKGKLILPALINEEVTAIYAGLRSATENSDYQISIHPEQRYIYVGGIRSTGISGCLGIAEYIIDLLCDGGMPFNAKPDFKKIKMPNVGEAFPRPYQSAERIAKNPDYGRIICHCERVSLGELRDAISSPIPAYVLEGLRRRTRAMQGRCQGFNCQATLLKTLAQPRALTTEHIESTEKKLDIFPGSTNSVVKNVDAVIVGAGPAGLSAALELKKLGVKNILVAERESEAGGIPRMCGHTGFGLRDLHRVTTGPNYARKYRELADEAGIKTAANTTIIGWNTAAMDGDSSTLDFTSPDGIGTIEAKSVLLATGVRERPRSARLIPGTRPQGVFTTGSLQRFVYEHHLFVGKRAVIVGAEVVSLSVVLTLMHADVKVLSMITELPRHQLYMPIFLPAKILYADILARAKIETSAKVVSILGKERVEGLEIRRLDMASPRSAGDSETGSTEVIECDTVVFTGSWIPENELARRGDVEVCKPSLGPQIDSLFRTSRRGVFAAGNVLRGVETADWAALEGRSAARSIARFLENAEWPATRIQVRVEAPLEWIYPNVITDSVPTAFRFQCREFRNHVKLGIHQGDRLLYEEHFTRLIANSPMNLTGKWTSFVDRAGEDVRILVNGKW
jgi:glycerol-3-phosphate dehydrogenase